VTTREKLAATRQAQAARAQTSRAVTTRARLAGLNQAACQPNRLVAGLYRIFMVQPTRSIIDECD